MTISNNSTSDFLQATMESAITEIRLLNITQERQNKECMAAMDEGRKLAAEELVQKSVKTGAELDALWNVYYTCERADKNISK